MKILQVGSPFADFNGQFGLTFRSSKGLIKFGHEVTIVTTDGDCFFFDKEKSDQYSKILGKLQNSESRPTVYDGVPLYALHCTMPRLGMYCPKSSEIAKKIIPKFDIVHVCGWYSHVGMVFAKTAKVLGVPFVISSWGSLLPGARRIKKKQKWMLDQIYTNKVLPKAAAFHSLGESETSEFIKIGASPDSVYNIGNIIVEDDFVIKRGTQILEKNNLKGRDFLLFLGRIHQKKGIELLLDAFKKIRDDGPDVVLAIAGFWTGRVCAEDKKTCPEHGAGRERHIYRPGIGR